jgi:hypothetical protein
VLVLVLARFVLVGRLVWLLLVLVNLPSTLLQLLAFLGMDPTENTSSVTKNACLLARYLAMDVLLLRA